MKVCVINFHNAGVSPLSDLLVTAAVCREPQLTLLISHDGDTSRRAGNAWMDMNTSDAAACSDGSSHNGGLVSGDGSVQQM